MYIWTSWMRTCCWICLLNSLWIKHSLHDITNMDRYIWVYTNSKLWMTKEVQGLLRERNTAFNQLTGSCTALPGGSEGLRLHNRGGLRTASRATTPGRCGEGSSTLLTTDTAACQLMMVASQLNASNQTIIDLRRSKIDVLAPFHWWDCVERVSNFMFLSMHIEDNFTGNINTRAFIKKAQQRFYLLRVLRDNQLTQRHLLCFYGCSIQSILTYCGPPTVQQQIWSCSRGSSQQPRKSPVPPFPPWKNSTAPTWRGRLSTSSWSQLTQEMLWTVTFGQVFQNTKF